MKTFYSIIFLLSVNFSATSQIADTCAYVDQINEIGGLDCAMLSIGNFTADSYQWLNCDNFFAPIPGDTTNFYSGSAGSITVALEISYLGCVDTSSCSQTCIWGLEELTSKKVKRISVVDSMGRETEDRPNTPVIYIYSDGTTEKVFRVH